MILLNAQSKVKNMYLKTFSYNGISYGGFTVDLAKNAGVPHSVINTVLAEIKWDEIRNKRDFLIINTDYTQVSDSPLSPEKKAEFTAYRQALRDIPQAYDNPDDIVWPTKPTI